MKKKRYFAAFVVFCASAFVSGHEPMYRKR